MSCFYCRFFPVNPLDLGRIDDGSRARPEPPELHGDAGQQRDQDAGRDDVRYAALYAAPQFAWLAARVPSLMQWDDHDISDGWGTLPRSRTYSPVGQTLFSVARESFLVFQQATKDGDLPARLADPCGIHLGWAIDAPELRIIAPDLRSERTRRQIMGPGGWAMMEAEASRDSTGHIFLMSSVPLLGPRLSVLAFALQPGLDTDYVPSMVRRSEIASWRRLLARNVLEAVFNGGGTSTARSVAIAAKGARNLLKHADILRGNPEIGPSQMLDMPDGSCFVFAEDDGMVEPMADLGDMVEAGAPVARIWPADRTGAQPVVYAARRGGILAGRHFPGLIKAGDCLVVVAELVA